MQFEEENKKELDRAGLERLDLDEPEEENNELDQIEFERFDLDESDIKQLEIDKSSLNRVSHALTELYELSLHPFDRSNYSPEIKKRVTEQKSNRLFFILGGFFMANAIIAEFIGVKIFSFEGSLGIPPLGLDPLGGDGALSFTAGVLLWPIVFIMTDVINEYYGISGVRFLSVLSISVITYGFLIVFIVIALEPADWWITAYKNEGVENMQDAYASVFGQGMWIIFGSLLAFFIGQIVDAIVFRKIKTLTGKQAIWFRATVSTMVSQMVDSYLVLYIAFVLGADWTMEMFISIGTTNYIYKVMIAVLFIPLLYFIHGLIDKYLGHEEALTLRELAVEKN